MLRLAKMLAIFALARRMTRKKLRILCYHGAELVDEAAFNPLLFISKSTFEDRMSYLESSSYVVLPLGEALALQADAELPDYPVVLTVDDGWYGTKSVMLPVIERAGFPITLYLSTYYVERQNTVWNVALDYLFWRHNPDTGNLKEALAQIGAPAHPKRLERTAAADALAAHIASLATAEERQSAFERVCTVLGHDPASITGNRQFGFVSESEVGELAERGFDIQLHTHRHRLSQSDKQEFVQEVAENRSRIRRMTGSVPVHFCYPSGQYSENQFQWLGDEGIQSATTTELGINGRRQERFALYRILDSNDWDTLQFEYEMSGLGHLVRSTAGWFRSALSNG